MAALLPTPSSDLDPGSRQRPGQQQVTTSHYSRICSSFLPWNHRKGAAEGTGCIRRSFSLSFPFFSKCLCLQFCLCCFASSPYLPMSPLSLPCPAYFLFFSSPFPWSLLLPSFLLSPVLLISLPQHPVSYLWCVLVLAKARPGRTGGYLLRQQSPWAPTLFPPPGAAQVSRWKVRGGKVGKAALGLKLGLSVLPVALRIRL